MTIRILEIIINDRLKRNKGITALIDQVIIIAMLTLVSVTMVWYRKDSTMQMYRSTVIMVKFRQDE